MRIDSPPPAPAPSPQPSEQTPSSNQNLDSLKAVSLSLQELIQSHNEAVTNELTERTTALLQDLRLVPERGDRLERIQRAAGVIVTSADTDASKEVAIKAVTCLVNTDDESEELKRVEHYFGQSLQQQLTTLKKHGYLHLGFQDMTILDEENAAAICAKVAVLHTPDLLKEWVGLEERLPAELVQFSLDQEIQTIADQWIHANQCPASDYDSLIQVLKADGREFTPTKAEQQEYFKRKLDAYWQSWTKAHEYGPDIPDLFRQYAIVDLKLNAYFARQAGR